MKIKKFFSVLLAVIIAVGALALPANAVSAVKDTSRDVNLTIYALEAEDGSQVSVDAAITGEKVIISDKKAIAGVSFNLYKVADDETSVEIPNGVSPITTGKSDSTGAVKVTIPADAQGRYLVVENEKPNYCEGTTIPFLVDLPCTNAEGTGFMYDVFAYPKQVVTGSVMLTKTFSGSAPTKGQVAVFTLTDANGNSTEYTTDPTTGVLYINDLSFGDYTIKETKVDSPYVISDKVISFTVSESGCVVDNNGTLSNVGTVLDLGTVDNSIPYQPSVSKEVSGDGGKTYGDIANLDVYNGDVATWKITAEVPLDIERYKVFIVGDILDERLIAPKASEVKAYFEGKELNSDEYVVAVKGQEITVDFDTQKLGKYEGNHIQIIFSTPIDMTKNDAIGVEIPNVATLTYTDVMGESTDVDTDTSISTDTDSSINTDTDTSISTDTDTSNGTDSDNTSTDTDTNTHTNIVIITTTVKVWTGEIDGFKHDSDNNPISGAEFTLYSDKDCKNAVATATSDKDGNFSFKGLKDGTYWLTETKAPNGYQKNDKVLEVKLSKDSNSSAVKVDVLNIKTPNLPLTGGAGTIGISFLGLGVLALGAFMIYLAIKTYRKIKLCTA